MAPVWEANNVWLIFALVVLWTAFPRAFAAIISTLYLPLALAVVLLVISRLPQNQPALAIVVFGLAGLSCSALLPLTISTGWSMCPKILLSGSFVAHQPAIALAC
jgi:hypothetical protein